MPILWTILPFDTQIELAQVFNLPVYVIKTKWDIEIRIKGIYYGDKENLDEIDHLMRIPTKFRGPPK